MKFREDRIVRPRREHVQPLRVWSAQQDFEERCTATAVPEIMTEDGHVDACDLIGAEAAALREDHVVEAGSDLAPLGTVSLQSGLGAQQ